MTDPTPHPAHPISSHTMSPRTSPWTGATYTIPPLFQRQVLLMVLLQWAWRQQSKFPSAMVIIWKCASLQHPRRFGVCRIFSPHSWMSCFVYYIPRSPITLQWFNKQGLVRPISFGCWVWSMGDCSYFYPPLNVISQCNVKIHLHQPTLRCHDNPTSHWAIWRQ